MKKLLISILFSLQTAFFSLAALALIFAVGSHLATIKPLRQVFGRMTDIYIWACLDDILANPQLFVWLIILVFFAAVLFVNTACCTSRQLSNYFKTGNASNRNKRLCGMAYIHVVALLVLVFHAVDVAFVQRHEPVKLFTGEQAVLGEYEIAVHSVKYVTDPSYITEDETGRRMPSFKIPADHFSIEENMAQVTLSKDGIEVQQADFRMFAPVRVGGTFFILDGFFIPHGGEQAGILLHRVHNPIALPFFGLYALLFSLFLYQCYVTRYRSVVSVSNRQPVAEVN